MSVMKSLLGIMLTVLLGVLWAVPTVTVAASNATHHPNRAVTIVVTFPPGGGTDLLARELGGALEQRWQVPVIIGNRPGASGNIGAQYLTKRAADGYTLLMVNSSFAVNPAVYKSLKFDPKKDFEPIVNVAWVPSVVITSADNAATTLEHALMPTGKNRSVAFASCGNGTPQHLAGELLAERTQAKLLHIPYKGCGPAVNDVLSGQVPMGFVTISSAMSFVKSGQLRPLAVTAPERSPVMPDVPTVAEIGVEGYELDQWHGLLAPAGTPSNILDDLHQTITDVIATEKMQDKLKNLGYNTTFTSSSSRQEFKDIIFNDIDRFQALAQRVGLRIN